MAMTLQTAETPSIFTSIHNAVRTFNALTDAVATTAELINNGVHHIAALEQDAYDATAAYLQSITAEYKQTV